MSPRKRFTIEMTVVCVAMLGIVVWVNFSSQIPYGLGILAGGLIGLACGQVYLHLRGKFVLDREALIRKETSMNRSRLAGLFWLAALLGVIAIAVIFYPAPGPPVGTGFAGHGIEIYNITEADFHDHYPGQPWSENGTEPNE